MKSLSQIAAAETFQDRSLLILIAIMALAAFLRIFLIGNHGLWLDEVSSLGFAKNNLQELIQIVTAFDNHPPTYYILLHYWILMFGDSEVSLRIPSAIFSVLSVLFTYKVGNILFDRRVAAIAALLLALSGFSIYYAQEARMYSLLAFTSVLSVYFLLKHLNKNTPWSLINYILSTTLLIYTHLYGLFILVAENLYILTIIYAYSEKNAGIQLKKWVSAQIYIFLLSLPWLVSLINRILVVDEQGFWVEIPTLTSIVKTFTAFSGTTKGLPIWLALLLLSILFALIIKTAPGRKILNAPSSPRHVKSVYFLSLLLLIPIVLPYLVSQFVTPIYIIRCTIAGHFAFYLLVAHGITRIRWMHVRFTALVLVLLLSTRSIAREDYVHRKSAQIRQAVEHIGDNFENNDVVIICGDRHLEKPFRYYAEKLDNPVTIVNIQLPNNELAIPENLEAGQLWFVRRTDRVERCGEFPHTISHRYFQTGMTNTTFRKLELTTLKNK